MTNVVKKVAVAKDSPRHLELFIKNTCGGTIITAMVELVPSGRTERTYEFGTASTPVTTPNQTFVENMIKKGLANIFKWITEVKTHKEIGQIQDLV